MPKPIKYGPDERVAELTRRNHVNRLCLHGTFLQQLLSSCQVFPIKKTASKLLRSFYRISFNTVIAFDYVLYRINRMKATYDVCRTKREFGFIETPGATKHVLEFVYWQ